MSIIEQIVDLQKNTSIDKSERGYLFENLIREIQPWDKKPPIVLSPKHEQLDGVFEYKNQVFIIESKAVEKEITPGSREWEDYELKLRKRKGQVIGIFCSLFDVTDKTINEANFLSKEGYPNILIYGNNWQQLLKDNFNFYVFLDFLILSTKVKFISSVKDLSCVKKWHFDSKNIENHFNTICSKESATFIRRNKHEKHESIFVERKISNLIDSHIKIFNPSKLKKSKNSDIQQILVIRDVSGSGKTTNAINYLINSKLSYSFGFSANQIEVDIFLENLLSKIEFSDWGLKELIAVDKPIVYIIDSLDEVSKNKLYEKRTEIKSLFRKIEELNQIAKREKLIRFPMLIIFTLRDDFWSDWDEVFDGRQIYELKNRQSFFYNNELPNAISKYSKAYNYKIINKLNPKSEQILSAPINLEVFSIANSYNGELKVTNIWEGEILKQYFKRKYEDIQSKHYIEGFSEKLYYTILTFIANKIILNKGVTIEKNNIIQLIKKDFPEIKLYIDDLINVFISEQILSTNPKELSSLKFKYNRFTEYLIALYLVRKISFNEPLSIIDNFIENILESHIIDSYTVLKNVRTICKEDKYKEIGKQITEYYQSSEIHLRIYLPKLRNDISYGKTIEAFEIKELKGKTASQTPSINWDLFFIICAKNNKQSKENIISSFVAAWETNSSDDLKLRRWKLIDKISHNTELLFNETIIDIIINDSIPKDWEVYLGKVLEKKRHEKDEFYELCIQIDLRSTLDYKINKASYDWRYVSRLFDILIENKPFINGDFLNEKNDNDYVIFQKEEEYDINDEIKQKIDAVISNLLNSSNDFYLNNLTFKSSEEIDYFNSEFNEKILYKYVTNKDDFIIYLIKNKSTKILDFVIRYYNFLGLEYSKNIDKKEDSALISIVENFKDNEYYSFELLEFLHKVNYTKNKIDSEYFKDGGDIYTSSIYFIVKAFYEIKNFDIFNRIRGHEKIIFTLYSFKYKTVVGFKFPQLISVAHNAIQHYRDNLDIITHAMKIYNLYSEFMSNVKFEKKIQNINPVEQDNSLNDALCILFPELF